jgi:deoxyribose-phosphate aldolase
MKNIKEILDQSSEYNQVLPAFPEGAGKLVQPINRYLDSAMHKPESTPAEVCKLCEEALEWQIAGVYTNPVYLPLVASLLKGSQVSVGSIAGFPLGGFLTTTKIFEARTYIELGASEIDMVLSVGQLKSGEYQAVLDDITAVSQEVHSKGKIIKVILETALLTRQEKITACLLAQAGNADFVKTSTGFSSSGATVEDVDLMRRVVGNTMKVKASAGIHTLEKAMALIHAGADRLGTSRAAQISADAQKTMEGSHG